MDDGGVAEAQVDRGGSGRPFQRPVDGLHAVAVRRVGARLQVRLVQLDDVGSRREQVPDLLADRLGVPEGEGLGAAVVIVLRLLRHGERPGDGDLDGPAGVRAQELQVLHLDRMPSPDWPGDPGHRIRVAAAVKGGAGVVDVHAFQRGREPVGVALPTYLAVREDVQASFLLGLDRQQRRIALRLLQVGGINPPQLPGPHPRREPAGERPGRSASPAADSSLPGKWETAWQHPIRLGPSAAWPSGDLAGAGARHGSDLAG